MYVKCLNSAGMEEAHHDAVGAVAEAAVAVAASVASVSPPFLIILFSFLSLWKTSSKSF